MTAVEWLINEHFGGIENCTPDFRYKINKAKEMEKEQIKDAWLNSLTKGDYNSAEQYYNKTFKSE